MVDRDHRRTRTLVDILRERAVATPDRILYTFLFHDGQVPHDVTFEQLDLRARAIARLLRRVAKGEERVLLLYHDDPDYIVGLFGCFYAGLVAVSGIRSHDFRSLERFYSIVRDSQATVVLGSATLLAEFQAAVDGQNEDLPLKWLPGEIGAAAATTHHDLPALPSSSLALLQYTSGSTRSPRGVMLSHANLLHNLAGQAKAFGYSERDVGVSWLPFSHDMGLIGAVLMALYAGCRCILMSSVHFLGQPIRWLQAISDYRATISGGPNFAYDLCVRGVTGEQKAGLNLKSWRVAFNGAEAVRPGTITSFNEAFRGCGFRQEAMYPCYGLAEATLFVAGGERAAAPRILAVDRDHLGHNRVVPVGDPGPETGCVCLVGCGRSMPDQQIVVADPDTAHPSAPGEVGEIWVAGPSVAQGYFGHPEDSDRTFHARLYAKNGPFLRTGDLGFMWDGELFVVGRLKDVMVIRGRNHYPQDVEATVEASHQALRHGCCSAFVIDVAGQEEVVVVCELVRGHETSADDAIPLIRRAVSGQHRIQIYSVVLVHAGVVPKTPNGKIQRAACRQAYLDDRLAIVHESRLSINGLTDALCGRATVPNDDERMDAIESWLRYRISAFGIDPRQSLAGMHLTSLNLDSVQIIALKASLEKAFSINVQLADLYEMDNFLHVADYVRDLCARKVMTGLSDQDAPTLLPPDLARLHESRSRLLRQHQSRRTRLLRS
jgi:acyl-CoA synthetase (AMP-forming)/AMP-acid ligase II/acyl carrier protein